MSRRLRPQDLSNITVDSYEQPEESNRGHRRAVLSVCSLPGSSRREEYPSSPKKNYSHNQTSSASSFSSTSSTSPQPPTRTLEQNSGHFPVRQQTFLIDDSESEIALVDLEKKLPHPPPASRSAPHDFNFDFEKHPQPQTPSISPTTARKSKIDREILKIMLLNMYPVTYLILWIPGIANRIAEATGHNIRALVILQSSTQYIGLANATVYLIKEHGKDISYWWNNRWIREEDVNSKQVLAPSTYSKI